jgi:hypothetical protein
LPNAAAANSEAMETLRLKARPPLEDDFESWDDGDFMIDDDTSFRSSSASTHQPQLRRESLASFRSDAEPNIGGAEEKQVHLPGDDEKSTLDAIAAAANAGIPIPKSVPPSALMGGTIKRLGGRKIKKIFQDDWGEDLELPDQAQDLHIKATDGSQFPDVIRQVSSAQPSPQKPINPAAAHRSELKPSPIPAQSINLDRFRDDEDDDGFLGDGSATIKVPKRRAAAKPISVITPPTSQKAAGEDDFEHDLELPSDGKLRLSTRREIPKTPAVSNADEFDWGEGSLGTRFGGTRRDGRSNRSSSASALSPSVSSSITAESEGEDDGLDGLILPEGPVNFGERLQQRKSQRLSQSPERPFPEEVPKPAGQVPATVQIEHDKEDVLTGLDLGDGDVFSSSKVSLHRNIQVKEARQTSPTRPKTAVSLQFTKKPVSRLPRPSHERTHTQTSLEPVSESGDPIPPNRRSQSRLGHSTQSSVSSIPQTPTTPSSVASLPPSTPRRREVNPKTSTVSLRNEPTTTSAQLLRLKRSLPAMRPAQSPARPLTSYDRPPSRADSNYRPHSFMRPKTPLGGQRATAETNASQARKNPLPFLPAGASQSQSHHVMSKSSRTFRRHDSENSLELRPSSRAVSRSTQRSPSPRKYQESTWTRLSRPSKLRQFGDGHELDGFDDLPTSSRAEAKFIRQPVSRQQQPLRNKVYQTILPDRTSTPSPFLHPATPTMDYVPHFARDTAASRIARQASISHRTPSNGPLAALTTQRSAQPMSRLHNLPIFLPEPTPRYKRPKRPLQLKPHLIANLNSSKESKSKFPRLPDGKKYLLMTHVSDQRDVLQSRNVPLGRQRKRTQCL